MDLEKDSKTLLFLKVGSEFPHTLRDTAWPRWEIRDVVLTDCCAFGRQFAHNHKWDNASNPQFGTVSGLFVGDIKFGSVAPPAKKPEIPFYNSSNLRQLQEEADKLKQLGVLARPDDLGVDVKFASSSFLRLKTSGAYRFINWRLANYRVWYVCVITGWPPCLLKYGYGKDE